MMPAPLLAPRREKQAQREREEPEELGGSAAGGGMAVFGPAPGSRGQGEVGEAGDGPIVSDRNREHVSGAPGPAPPPGRAMCPPSAPFVGASGPVAGRAPRAGGASGMDGLGVVGEGAALTGGRRSWLPRGSAHGRTGTDTGKF